MSGWIKLHRTIAEHWIFSFDEPEKALAWIDLILKAGHKDREINIKGRIIALKRGQQARSEVTLSKEWRWSRDKVRRFLSLLEKQGMIRQQKTNLTSIISICNYDDYQDDKTAGNTADKTADKTAVDTGARQQSIHKQECKKERMEEGKKSNTSRTALDFSSWPSMPSDQVWADYKKLRQAKKAPLSQTVINKMANTLTELSASGIGVDQAIEIACERGWQGFKAEWVINHVQANNTQQPSRFLSKQERREEMKKERDKRMGLDDSAGDYIEGEVIG